MARLQAFQRHAITAPVFDKTKLHRPRLVQILQDNLWRKLILIVAPAGYGKTTLLADLTAHTDRPVCWVRLTEHDQDAMRLARLVIDSLGRRFPRVRKQLTADGLEAYSPEAAGKALGHAIADALSRPLVIVIDDFHHLAGSEDGLLFMTGLVRRNQGNICYVVSSREISGIPIARETVDQNVATVGPEDLAFTSDELEAFLAASRFAHFDARQGPGLMEDTGGWIAGILLIMGQDQLAPTIGAGRGLGLAFDYFASEVLARVNESLRAQIIESSVLPVMTAEAIEATLGVEQGARWLELIRRKGMFMTVSRGGNRTYEYHALFRDFLGVELRKTYAKRRIQRLLGRAAKHLEANGAESYAVDLFWDAGRIARALGLAERISDLTRRRGETTTVNLWVDLADRADLAALELRAAQIEGIAARGDGRAAKKLIKQILRRYGAKLERIQVLGLLAWDAWISVFGRNPTAAARKARAILSEVGSNDCHRAGRLANATAAYFLWVRERNLDTAEMHARAAVRAARLRRASSVAYIENLYSNVLVARGRSEAARRADKRASWETSGARGFGQVIEKINSAYWAQRDMRWSEALQLCHSAVALGQSLSLRDETCQANILLGEIHTNLGMTFDAVADFDRADRAPIDEYPHWAMLLYTSYARALRFAGDQSSASRWLAKARLLPPPYKNSSMVSLETWALQDETERGRRGITRLARRLRASEGTASARVLADAHRALSLWKSGSLEVAERAFLSAARLGLQTGNLQYLCGELLAQSSFAAFLEGRLPSEASVTRLWEGLTSAEKARVKAIQAGSATHLDTGFSLDALGIECVKSHGLMVRLKPLFAEVLFFIVDRKLANLDDLLETFWPSRPLGKQRAAAHTALHAIRKALGEKAVHIRGELVSLREDALSFYDVDMFETMAQNCLASVRAGAADMSVCEQAIALYGGPFLLARSRQWVLDRRRLLGELFRRLVLIHAREALVRSEYDRAYPVVSRALGYDPLDEEIALVQAKLLFMMGRNAHALEALRALRVRLRTELDLDPTSEFDELESQVTLRNRELFGPASEPGGLNPVTFVRS